jgi:hypothetical protein
MKNSKFSVRMDRRIVAKVTGTPAVSTKPEFAVLTSLCGSARHLFGIDPRKKIRIP